MLEPLGAGSETVRLLPVVQRRILERPHRAHLGAGQLHHLGHVDRCLRRDEKTGRRLGHRWRGNWRGRHLGRWRRGAGHGQNGGQHCEMSYSDIGHRSLRSWVGRVTGLLASSARVRPARGSVRPADEAPSEGCLRYGSTRPPPRCRGGRPSRTRLPLRRRLRLSPSPRLQARDLHRFP